MPFPLMALASLGLPFLGGLLGRHDNTAKLQEYIKSILSENAVSGRANDIMKYFYGSPAYSQVQGLSMQAGRQAQSSAASMGAGMGVTSGMDVLRRAVASGVGSGTLAQIVAQRAQQAHGEAYQGQLGLANAAAGVGPAPNYTNELLGSSLSFLGPLLGGWMQNKYGLNPVSNNPQSANFMGPRL